MSGWRTEICCKIETHSTDEGGDEGDTSLGTGDGLTETEEKGQVAATLLGQLHNESVF
jgi:hypothetical protein